MNLNIVDFRSDTVTCPDGGMRKAIFEASVGDSGYGDDPSINELESLAADIVGQEAAIFVPSGVMGNITALGSHCRRGEAVLVGDKSHIYRYEGGGLSAIAGLLPYALDDSSGLPSPESVLNSCPEVNVHFAQTSLLCLEVTHNDRGGLAQPLSDFKAVVEAGREKGLAIHLDGARVFNSAVAWGVDVKEYTSSVDSVQFCLSKGLGAPMGAMLCGSEEFISRARFERKRLGGELRQAGFMAAAGIYALKNNIPKLLEDHENGQVLADTLAQGGLIVEPVPQGTRRTNMVYVNLAEKGPSSSELAASCKPKGVLFNDMEPRRFRLVTHLGMDREEVIRGANCILREALTA
ncbi:threonine aldolase family protein [Dethiosulfovibrio salsuginis]|uniref:threonine aldolase family protein n=1 Tax=Dethiosulfovibrio salsuginis TaxID=561720 RepID=UPI000A1C9ADD|nr:GntG family PLP-dependent aldolase [Dethiosulfovibrio salsuginis]